MYNNYSTKSKFTEVVLAAAPIKTFVSACASDGSCVVNNAIAFAQASSGTPPTAGAASLSVAPSLYAWYDAQSAYFAAYYAENTAAAVIVDPAQPNNYCVAYNGSGVCAPARCTPCAATIPAATIGPQYVAPATPGSPATPGASLPCVGPAGCSPPTKYVAQASANSVGIITAVAQTTSGLNAETFVLVPQLSGGRVDWSASGTCKTRAGGALC